MLTIDVRTLKKAKKIIEALKKQGRRAFYEEFADYDGFFYTIFYRPIKEVSK